jgi:hypothetical protein
MIWPFGSSDDAEDVHYCSYEIVSRGGYEQSDYVTYNDGELQVRLSRRVTAVCDECGDEITGLHHDDSIMKYTELENERELDEDDIEITGVQIDGDRGVGSRFVGVE